MQRPYLKDRLIENRPEGYVVIVPVDAIPPVPLACPTCKYVMRSKDDELEYGLFGCCDYCARLWARPRKNAWAEGWRPTHEQIIDAELVRPQLKVNFDID